MYFLNKCNWLLCNELLCIQTSIILCKVVTLGDISLLTKYSYYSKHCTVLELPSEVTTYPFEYFHWQLPFNLIWCLQIVKSNLKPCLLNRNKLIALTKPGPFWLVQFSKSTTSSSLMPFTLSSRSKLVVCLFWMINKGIFLKTLWK